MSIEYVGYFLMFGPTLIIVLLVYFSGRMTCLVCGGTAVIQIEPYAPYRCKKCGSCNQP